MDHRYISLTSPFSAELIYACIPHAPNEHMTLVLIGLEKLLQSFPRSAMHLFPLKPQRVKTPQHNMGLFYGIPEAGVPYKDFL